MVLEVGPLPGLRRRLRRVVQVDVRPLALGGPLRGRRVLLLLRPSDDGLVVVGVAWLLLIMMIGFHVVGSSRKVRSSVRDFLLLDVRGRLVPGPLVVDEILMRGRRSSSSPRRPPDGGMGVWIVTGDGGAAGGKVRRRRRR